MSKRTLEVEHAPSPIRAIVLRAGGISMRLCPLASGGVDVAAYDTERSVGAASTRTREDLCSLIAALTQMHAGIARSTPSALFRPCVCSMAPHKHLTDCPLYKPEPR